MRLDLEKIKELELAYQENPTALNTLINLIDAVTSDTKDLNRSSLQYKTLLDLGVIREYDCNTKIKQLNS